MKNSLKISSFYLAGQQEDEKVAGGGAEGAQGPGESGEASVEEHERPDVGRNEPLKTSGASAKMQRVSTVPFRFDIPQNGPESLRAWEKKISSPSHQRVQLLCAQLGGDTKPSVYSH